MILPTYELELAYAVEVFDDEHDRQPDVAELREIEKQTRRMVDEMTEAYGEWKALHKVSHGCTSCRDRDGVEEREDRPNVYGER